MHPRDLLAGLVAGLAAALLVGVGATELLAGWIEFSLLVGIPAGLLAGAVVGVAVALFRSDPNPGGTRAATALTAFGGAFLLALAALVALSLAGLAAAILVAALVGIGVGVAAYLRTGFD